MCSAPPFFLNFIFNAIKYNKQGGDVWVEWVLKENDKVYISIRNNEWCDRIFQHQRGWHYILV